MRNATSIRAELRRGQGKHRGQSIWVFIGVDMHAGAYMHSKLGFGRREENIIVPLPHILPGLTFATHPVDAAELMQEYIDTIVQPRVDAEYAVRMRKDTMSPTPVPRPEHPTEHDIPITITLALSDRGDELRARFDRWGLDADFAREMTRALNLRRIKGRTGIYIVDWARLNLTPPAPIPSICAALERAVRSTGFFIGPITVEGKRSVRT